MSVTITETNNVVAVQEVSPNEIIINQQEILITIAASGAPGPTGGIGPQGNPGPGVAVGGTTGQVLTKIDNTNYNTQWTTPSPGVTDHTLLSNIGTNSHAQIDSHISSTSNPHAVTKSQVGLGNVDNTSDLNKPISTATQTALDLKVDENAAITGATKTKITYDSKGLVTAGTDATTADINDSSNRRYVSDAQLVVIGNTSGTNTGDQNLSGYELLSNKATDLTVLNNTLYPTTQAVQSALNAAITTTPVYMLSGVNSDISGYESAVALAGFASGALATISQTVTTSETLIEEFATNLNFPNTTALPVGLFSAHYEMQKSGGSQFYYSYFKIFKRNSGGTETLLLTSDNSSQTSSNSIEQIDLTAFNSAIIPLLTTDRIVLKIYAIMLTGSQSIDLRYDNNTDARLQLPGSSLTYVPENVANKSTDGNLTANSTTLYPSQSAVKTYADAKVDNVITDGVTTIAPSQNAVFDALALKANTSSLATVATSGSHLDLSNIGTNSHATIDTHIGASSAHGVSGSIVGTSDSQVLTNKTIDADLNTVSNIKNSDIKNLAAIAGSKINPTVVTLTDATTIVVNATLGNQFTVTITANRTLGNPSGAYNGQLLLFAIRQNGTGGFSLTPDTKYRFGDDITDFSGLNLTANKTTYIGVRYHSGDDKFDVISFKSGY